MMLRLAKAFWDIALWRRSPAQLPASLFLLALVAAAAALIEVLSVFLPPVSNDRMSVRILLSVALPLAFTWAVLLMAHRRHRFLQTGIALLGVEVVVELILYPLGSLIHVVGSEGIASMPIEVMMLVGLIWYMLACANIWRVALDSGLALGIAISVGYFLLSLVLEQRLLPNA
jgi:hypothetical protein